MKGISNLPPIKPSSALGRNDMKILEKQQKELDSYITEFVVDRFDQKEWSKKTIKTREKLEKLESLILDKKPNYEGIPPMEIMNHLLSSVKVDEPIGGRYYIRVRTLSQKGVNWCNKMWKRVK